MASKKKYFKSTPLTISQQHINMKAKFPSFKARIIKRDKEIIWTGYVQPSPLSEKYQIKVEYSVGDTPNVYVLSPKLQKRSEEARIPHTYPGDRLCLYLPRLREWTSSNYISETIIPWTSLWLYYYEVWFATGLWMGGGEHPDIRTKDE